MANTFTEVSRMGVGTNLARSFVGLLMGIGLFFGSFVVLWTNEGRVDLSLVAKESIAVDPNKVDPTKENKLVAVTGEVQLLDQIGDFTFLKPGPYLSLKQVVEMYAWVETTKTKTEKQTGGSSVQTTEYTYTKEWTESPKDSSQFKYPANHANPPQRIHGDTFQPGKAALGAYVFIPHGTELPTGETLHLTQDQLLNLHHDVSVKLSGDTYLFSGDGTLANPSVGDLRIHYVALIPKGTYTLLGQQQGNAIENYYDSKRDVSLHRLFEGSRDQAISTLAAEHKVMTWGLRIVGFLMMWFGFILFLSPLTAALDFIPFLGSAGRFVTGLVLLPISMVLSLLTIFVSIIAHNVVLLIIVLVAAAGGLGWLYKTAKKKQAAV